MGFTQHVKNAQLMAEAERAKLILQLEPPDIASKRNNDLESGLLRRDSQSGVEKKPGTRWEDAVNMFLCRGTDFSVQAVFPKWLHVLMPITSEEETAHEKTTATLSESPHHAG